MADSAANLFTSLHELQQQFADSLPPVDRWNPALNGDIDIRIDREGKWFYQGNIIRRRAMVKLFASVLKREGDDYFLVTPVEKWRIRVDEAPFVFTLLRVEQEADTTAVVLTTNTGHDILLGPANPFWMQYTATGEPRPMARVYRNLTGLLNRNVFYQLVELCSEDDNTGEMFFYSADERFVIGTSRGK